MTNYGTYEVLGSNAVLVAKGKGSLKNRAQEGKEQFKNRVKWGAKETAVATGTVAGAVYANKALYGKAPKWSVNMNKCFKKGIQHIKDFFAEGIKQGHLDPKTLKITKESAAKEIAKLGRVKGRMTVFAGNAVSKISQGLKFVLENKDVMVCFLFTSELPIIEKQDI